MKIRHIVGSAVLGMALPMAAFADKEDKAEDVVNALNLDDQRGEEVQQVLENFHDQKKEVKERSKDQISSLKDQKEERLQAILTDDEFEQYENLQEAKKDRKDKKHKGRDHS